MKFQVVGYQRFTGKGKKGPFDFYKVYLMKDSEGIDGAKGLLFDKDCIYQHDLYLTPEEFTALGIDVGRQYEYWFTKNQYGFFQIAKESIRRVK